MTKILLVDDNKQLRMSYKRVLSRYEVDEASSTDEAIEMAKKTNYDFVLTDKDLEDNYGNRGGIHLAKTLREAGYDKGILLHSADLRDEDMEELNKIGVESCPKQESLSRLRKALEKYK